MRVTVDTPGNATSVSVLRGSHQDGSQPTGTVLEEQGRTRVTSEPFSRSKGTILIGLMCFVASFKLSCVQLLLVDRVYCCSCVYCCWLTVCIVVVVLCVLFVDRVYCCSRLVCIVVG